MTQPGQSCPVCGVPDPEHDWDRHDQLAAGVVWTGLELEDRRTAAAMLARSSSRGGAKVRWLAVHSTEGIMRARDLLAWSSWPGSSHASADRDGVLLTPADGFVPYDRAAWTLRDGNPVSENIELCALASWTREQWLARPKLLDACARWLADRARATSIPLRKLTVAQVDAGWAGVIDHDDYTDATGDGTHWDVGEQFPWDVVIPAAQHYLNPPKPTPEPEDPDVAFTEQHARLLEDLHYGLRRPVINGVSLSAAIRDVQQRVARLDDQDPDGPTLTAAAAPEDPPPWDTESLQLLADTLHAELTLEQRQELAEQLLPEHSRP